MSEAEIIAQMQRYAKQIYDRAMLGQKPGAALANYMRTLRELDEARGIAEEEGMGTERSWWGPH